MKKIYGFVLLLIGMFVSLIFDKSILNFLIQFRYESLNSFFIVLSHWSVVVILAVIISLVYFLKKWKNLLMFWTTIVLSYLFATVFKLIFMRARPDVLNLIVETSYAFPSRHVAVLFAFLPILFREKKGIWVLGIAVVISYTRVYLGVHYLSDVFGGIILGLLIGYLILFLEKKYGFFDRLVTKR